MSNRAVIAVFGEVYSSNLGDALIYDCLSYLLSEHKVEILAVDLSGKRKPAAQESVPAHGGGASHGRVRRLLGYIYRTSRSVRRLHTAYSWYFRRRRLVSKEWEDVIRSSDYVIVGGGQLLTDVNFGFPPKIHEVKRLAARHNKPLAVFGVGVGLALGFVASHLYRDVARYASYISTRDRDSAEALVRLGIPIERIEVHPDVAFCASIVHPVYGHDSGGAQRTLGLNVQPFDYFKVHLPELRGVSIEQFRDTWVRVVDSLPKDLYTKVILFSNGDARDQEECGLMACRLNEKGISAQLLDRPISVSDLIAAVTAVDELVSTRMHAGIAAYSYGKHVVPISWDPKVFGVWETVGGADKVVSGRVFGSADGAKTITYGIESAVYAKADIGEHMKDLREAVSRCVGSLSNGR